MADSSTTEVGTDSVSFGGLIDDQEQEKREDRQLGTELGAFFNAIDRLVTMMRVYPLGHPLLDELSNQLLARLQPTLDREGSVFFNIDAQELTTTLGTVVYSEELAEKGSYIWYGAYSDGLLQVELEDGVTTEELVSFLRVIDRSARGVIQSDDDTVTLLWEQQLEYIHHFAVEGFVDGGILDDFGEKTEKEAINMIVDAALDPAGSDAGSLAQMFDNLSIAHLDLFTKMQIEANAQLITPELKDDDLAYAFAVDEKLVDTLHGEWKAGADLEYRLIEALLAIIRVAPSSAGAQRATAMISNVMHQLLDSQMYVQAVRVLELLKSRRELFAGAEVDPLGDLVEELSNPMQVEALINLFQRNKQRDAMMELFRLLGHIQVTKQVLMLLADPNRKVVAMKQLVDLLFELYDDEVMQLYTDTKLVSKSIYLRRLLGEIAHRKVAVWPPAQRLLRRGLDDSSEEVRELALNIEHPCWDDPNIARDYLQPMSADPVERIRKLALGLLSERHPELFRSCIRETILARKVGDRTHGELRYLMRLLQKAPGGTETLRELLEIRGWFGSDAVEYAKMAAVVLVEADDAQGIAAIESKMNQFLTAPALKKAYAATLKRFRNQKTSGAPPAADQPDATPPAERHAAREAIEVPEEEQPAVDDSETSDPETSEETERPRKPGPSEDVEPPEDSDPSGEDEPPEDFDFDWDDDD